MAVYRSIMSEKKADGTETTVYPINDISSVYSQNGYVRTGKNHTVPTTTDQITLKDNLAILNQSNLDLKTPAYSNFAAENAGESDSTNTVLNPKHLKKFHETIFNPISSNVDQVIDQMKTLKDRLSLLEKGIKFTEEESLDSVKEFNLTASKKDYYINTFRIELSRDVTVGSGPIIVKNHVYEKYQKLNFIRLRLKNTRNDVCLDQYYSIDYSNINSNIDNSNMLRKLYSECIGSEEQYGLIVKDNFMPIDGRYRSVIYVDLEDNTFFMYITNHPTDTFTLELSIV